MPSLARTIAGVAILTLVGVGPSAAQTRPVEPAPSQLFRTPPRVAPSLLSSSIPLPPAPDSTSSNGALNGAFIGAGIGGALGLLSGTALCDEGCSTGAKWQGGFGMLLAGAAVGAVLGGIIGSL